MGTSWGRRSRVSNNTVYIYIYAMIQPNTTHRSEMYACVCACACVHSRNARNIEKASLDAVTNSRENVCAGASARRYAGSIFNKGCIMKTQNEGTEGRILIELCIPIDVIPRNYFGLMHRPRHRTQAVNGN